MSGSVWVEHWASGEVEDRKPSAADYLTNTDIPLSLGELTIK